MDGHTRILDWAAPISRRLRERRVNVAAILVFAIVWVAPALMPDPVPAQIFRSQTYTQEYYSPEAEARRQRNTCLMQRKVTPGLATMCVPGRRCQSPPPPIVLPYRQGVYLGPGEAPPEPQAQPAAPPEGSPNAASQLWGTSDVSRIRSIFDK